jgi:hypothetical protein
MTTDLLHETVGIAQHLARSPHFHDHRADRRLAAWAVLNIAFVGCDGLVAAEQAAMLGVELRRATMHGELIRRHIILARKPTQDAAADPFTRRRSRTSASTTSETETLTR